MEETSDKSEKLRKDTEKILATLSPQKELVLRLRFGFHELRQFSHEEIGQSLNLSKDDVIRIEEEALRDLRSYDRVAELQATIVGIAEKKIESVELTEVIETANKITPDMILHLKKHESDIEKLKPDIFEQLVGEFLAQQGFKDVRLVGRDPSTSADIYAVLFQASTSLQIKIFIEVKHTKNKIGIGVINQVSGAMFLERPEYGWHAAMIVSLVGFTETRKILRQDLELRGIMLRDREDLLRWLEDYKPNPNGLWLPSLN